MKFQIEEKGSIGEPSHRVSIVVEVTVDDLIAQSSKARAGSALALIRVPHPSSRFQGAEKVLSILGDAAALPPGSPGLGPLFDSKPKTSTSSSTTPAKPDAKSRAAGERDTDPPEKKRTKKKGDGAAAAKKKKPTRKKASTRSASSKRGAPTS